MKGRQLRRLYFDSSVYGFIHECLARNPNEAKAVRRWLRTAAWQLVASDEANLGEAIDIPEVEARAERVRLILQLATWAKPPIDLVLAEEVFREVARHHRPWVRRYIGQQDRKRYLDFRFGETWARLENDPTAAVFHTRPDLVNQKGDMEQALTANKQAQKERRLIRRVAGSEVRVQAVDSELGDILNALPHRERYWRVHMYQEYTLLLLNTNLPSAETDWLPELLDFESVFEDGGRGWQRFWAVEADPTRMPANYLYVASVECQEEHKADRGASVDRIHLCYLHSCDAVVTADRGLYETMVCALKIAPSRGQPVFINRGAPSALAELQSHLQSRT
jgi:hypothetical protein